VIRIKPRLGTDRTKLDQKRAETGARFNDGKTFRILARDEKRN
jgi:hypothetical protein